MRRMPSTSPRRFAKKEQEVSAGNDAQSGQTQAANDGVVVVVTFLEIKDMQHPKEVINAPVGVASGDDLARVGVGVKMCAPSIVQ